jgi:cell division GTPase FtsZ
MNVLLIGFGQAGGTIVDECLRYEAASDRSFIGGTLAVDTETSDLTQLEQVPQRHRILIGQSRVKGHGVGADNELGAEIAEDDIDELQGGLDRFPMHEIDAFVIVAGLGGGTGSGGVPVLAKHLQQIYVEPVYGLGILPATDEGGIYSLNAARSLRPFVQEVDNLFVFDNDAWMTPEDTTDYATVNEELVRRLAAVFAVPDDDGEDPVSSTDVIETLSTGGVTSIGFAAEEIERSQSSGLLSSLTGGGDDAEISDSQKTNRITSQVRKSTLGRLTLPAEIESATRALLVVSGPPEHLTRDGIERGRKWLQEQTGADRVYGGTAPVEAEYVAATAVLSGLQTVPRIDELEEIAREAGDELDGSVHDHEGSAQEAEGSAQEAEEGAEPTEAPADDAEPGTAASEREPLWDLSGSESESPPASDSADADADTGVDADVDAQADADTRDDERPEGEAEPAGERAASTAESETEETTSGHDPTEPATDRIPPEIPATPSMELRYDDIEIGDLLGGGGNADVHEARAPDGERLAVKLPRFEGTLHTEDIERVIAEAETWSKLDDHDHIVDVVDYGETPRPWIAMEYMDGGTLADRIDDLEFAEAAWIAARIAAAIEHAHRRGVAHLDLKPENVLFRSTPGEAFDAPKVADWGLSKHLLEHTGSVDGLSTQYAAPEQFDSDAYGDSSDRTDVYQLGTIVYELFTGRPPFEGSTASVMNSILNDEPEPPTGRDPSLPDAVDGIVMRALESEQGDRYDHVVLFRRELEGLAPDDAA